ncbi:MAG: hypothetical protein AAF479_00615 [Pseudomonadota bacterium]
MTSVTGQIIVQRKLAAKSALRIFDHHGIRSANDPMEWKRTENMPAWVGDLAGQDRAWGYVKTYRSGPDNMAQGLENALRTGYGNCHEKGQMCYTSLKSNPRLGGHCVTLMTSNGYDHVFVVVSDVQPQDHISLDQIGHRAMIVDGWTQDWYFPNVGYPTAINYYCVNMPNARQKYVRNQIKSHTLRKLQLADLPDDGAKLKTWFLGNYS